METNSRDWCTAKEAAQLFKCSTSYVQLMARQGKIRRVYQHTSDPTAARYWYNVDDLAACGPIKSFKLVKKRVPVAQVETAPALTPAPTPKVATKTNEQRLLALVAAGQVSIEGALMLLEMLAKK